MVIGKGERRAYFERRNKGIKEGTEVLEEWNRVCEVPAVWLLLDLRLHLHISYVIAYWRAGNMTRRCLASEGKGGLTVLVLAYLRRHLGIVHITNIAHSKKP